LNPLATVFGSEVRMLLTRTDIEEVDFEFDPIISLIATFPDFLHVRGI